ncbi:MAG: prefoldin subunit alpha [Nanoarchaeota archaeon]|nr:prefoldin subunit alpha [Nanoarchaeota archaeon]
MENKEQQEILQSLGAYEQQLDQLRQQFQAVEEGIVELGSLNLGLDDLQISEGKEILAPVGRGVFVKAKLIPGDLIVDVGNKNLVKKNIPETKKIIENQIATLEELKKDLGEKMEEIQEEATHFLEKLREELPSREELVSGEELPSREELVSGEEHLED